MITRIVTALLLTVFFVATAAAQALPRTSSRTASLTEGERSMVYETAVPRATVRTAFKYMLAHYATDDYYTNYDLYRMPTSTDLFLATAYNGTELFLLLLRKDGNEIAEVSQVKRQGCGLAQPYFFAGRDRVLFFIANSAPDGGFCGNWAFEFQGGRWKELGEIDVYDAQHGKGAFQGHSPLERATAKFANGRYSLTMRGRGTLYSFDDKVLARRGVPVTLTFDGTNWVK